MGAGGGWSGLVGAPGVPGQTATGGAASRQGVGRSACKHRAHRPPEEGLISLRKNIAKTKQWREKGAK